MPSSCQAVCWYHRVSSILKSNDLKSRDRLESIRVLALSVVLKKSLTSRTETKFFVGCSVCPVSWLPLSAVSLSTHRKRPVSVWSSLYPHERPEITVLFSQVSSVWVCLKLKKLRTEPNRFGFLPLSFTVGLHGRWNRTFVWVPIRDRTTVQLWQASRQPPPNPHYTSRFSHARTCTNPVC